MALHCNFQGLVAESNSVRAAGNGGASRAASGRLLLKRPRGLHISCRCRCRAAPDNAQNLLRPRLADALMRDAGCADVTWSHAWNSVCGGSRRCFLLVCGGLVNNMQGVWDALLPLRTLPPPCFWSGARARARPQACPPNTGADCLPGNSPPRGLTFKLSRKSFL